MGPRKLEARFPALILRYALYPILIAAAVINVAGCGSGGGGGGTSTGGGQPSPDFSIALSPASLTVSAGGSATTTVSVNGANGFNSPVTLTITGLPTGITFSPSTPQATPASSAQITFTAASSAVGTSINLTITGSSGSLIHTTQLAVTVKVPSTYSSRTRYRRTDSATEYYQWSNQNWMVYDPVTNRFFVSDPGLNRIVVLDAASESEIATITVPGAFGIDETPDRSTIYAGTQIGDVYAIDPVGMQVTHRYIASQIGSTGFHAYSVRVLANGELALLGGPGSAPDGFGGVAVWNPSSNAITTYGGTSPFCGVRYIGAFTLTGDRSLIVVGDADTGTLCTLNPVTGQQNSVPSRSGTLDSVAATPDGTSLLVSIYQGLTGQIAVFNAQTLTRTSIFSVAADTSSMIVSPDSQTLYIDDGGGSGMLYAYNLASGTLAGWLPNLMVSFTSGGSAFGPAINPNLQAFDNTGLIAGPMEEGVGFLDTTALRTGSVGSGFTIVAPLNPATGSVAGGTQTEWLDNSQIQSATLTAAYFAGNVATSISQSGTDFYATTPAGSAGPADLYAPASNGGLFIFPEAFSYGPTILEVTPGTATADGGGTGTIYGYGFGATGYNIPVPSDLQISIGGKPATVTGYIGDAYNIDDPPFPLEAATYTIPSGTAGTSGDVTVTSSSGTATLAGGFQYLPSTQQFSLSGASSLAQGIYDSAQDIYYFTDASEIRVFSRTQGQWLTPIQVPAAPSGTTHRLWGIALSPDGSKLAVSDQGASVIYLIDPDSTTSIQTFPTTFGGSSLDPAGLAISDSGMIYFATSNVPPGSYECFFKLSTSSGQITPYPSILGDNLSPLFRTAISLDNSQVFFNND